VKKKFLIAATILAALVVLLITALFVLRGKSPLVSDDDLQFTRAVISSNENAFFILEEAQKEIFWPEDKSGELKEILNWKSWDNDFVHQIIQENKKTLELFDKAQLCPQLQIPPIEDFVEDYTYLVSWKSTGQIALLRAMALFREGKENAAVDETFKILRFGHQIEGCDGTVIHYLVGVAIKSAALRNLQHMIGNGFPPCTSARSHLNELSQFHANQPGLTNVFKTEYRVQKKMVDDMAVGKMPGVTNSNAQSITRITRSPVFNPGKTQDIFAQVARAQIDGISRPYSEMQSGPVSRPTKKSPVKLLLSGNAVGEVLTQMLLPAQEKFMAKKCQENVTVAATQVLVALKCFKEKHGSLPSSLEELAPEFLPNLPMDDFDGKQLRYSVEKKIIYSIGPDLVDSDGEEKDAQKKTLDIPFKIEF